MSDRRPSGPVRAALASLVCSAAALGPAVLAPGRAGAVADGGGSGPPAAPGGQAAASGYRPPVDAPVVDPFREPSGPYGPGNRGLEYRTTPGTPVRAMGPGVVAFAGPVAGRLVVSVVHPDGLRSALTGLAAVLVRVGQRVDADTVVGAAGPLVHLGVRRGDRYLDPATLFGVDGPPRRAVLVPLGTGGPA